MNTPSHNHNSRFATGIRAKAIAFLLVAVIAPAVAVSSASAASPGVFNYAQCIPSSRRIVQDVEAYRSTANEYVVLQAALVNQSSGATSYSSWAVGTGSTAHAAFTWSSVNRGTYNVFYHWAVWNYSTRRYVYSGWVRLTGAALNTYGAETFPGSGIFIGGQVGRCTI